MMTQVIFHRGKKYISEDLDYYFSTERDKNNQIRPSKTIISMFPDTAISEDNFKADKINNFFYPKLPNEIDRIYIGISVSLFSNHWGASFLIELLKLVKPGGVIILPVYPENQAGEKGFWSRSFLENIFLSRSRWKGISNVNAENDGVMSLRVGKKMPDPHPSSIEWFFQERSNVLLSSMQLGDNSSKAQKELLNTFNALCGLIWQAYTCSAIVEHIMLDNLNTRNSLSIKYIGNDYGLLINDLMLSPQLQIERGKSCHIGYTLPTLIENISSYFDPITQGNHCVYQSLPNEVNFVESYDVVILQGLVSHTDIAAYEWFVKETWSYLNSDGLLILSDDLSGDLHLLEIIDKLLSEIGNIKYYSNIVASEIEPDISISQYSLAVEEDLRQEARNKDKVFRVLQK